MSLNRIHPFLVGNTELTVINSGLNFVLNHHTVKSSFYDITPTQPTNTTITMTIANPCVVTWNAHGRVDGDRVQFTTTGALPTGVVATTSYFVRNINANTFHLYDTQANALNTVSTTGRIVTTGSQSGTHTVSINAHKTFTFENINEFETIMIIFNSTNPVNTVSWHTGSTGYTIRWGNQTAPSLTTTANRKDIITFIRVGNDIFGGFTLGC